MELKYFGEPKDYGWLNFYVNDKHETVIEISYINTHLIKRFLEAFILLYKTKQPQVVFLDNEGEEHYIVFDYYNWFIVECDENNELITYTDNRATIHIIKDFLRSVDEHFDKWINFNYLELEDFPKEEQEKIKKEYAKERTQYKRLIKKLKDYVQLY